MISGDFYTMIEFSWLTFAAAHEISPKCL